VRFYEHEPRLQDASKGDIRMFDRVAETVRGADVVFHLAAQSNVMGAVLDPNYSITTNVIGTFNVLRRGRGRRAARGVHLLARGVRRSRGVASR
jgi:nucleoside-diphosphate-sugar epimerase